MKLDETPEGIESLATNRPPGGGLEPTLETIEAFGGPQGEAALLETGDAQARLERDLANIEVVSEGQSLSPTQAALRRLGRDRRAMICLALTLLIIVTAYVGPLIYTRVGPGNIVGGITGTQTLTPMQYHNYAQIDIVRQHAAPFTALHPLGTDDLGRDILARLMAGVNVSIEVAILVEILDVGLGLLIGTFAGYYGGWLATLLDRFTDIMFAFPGLLFAILAAATLGAAFSSALGLPGRLILVSMALGIAVWPFMARLVRGQTLQLREQQFIEAARTVGTSDLKIILTHIVPNLLNVVVVAAVLDMVSTIVAEAVISLLGLGVQTPGSSLGLMINEASAQLQNYPIEVLWPVVVLAILVLAFSFVGDGVQDAFNPRTKD